MGWRDSNLHGVVFNMWGKHRNTHSINRWIIFTYPYETPAKKKHHNISSYTQFWQTHRKNQWKFPPKYGLIWYSTSILGSWNSHWKNAKNISVLASAECPRLQSPPFLRAVMVLSALPFLWIFSYGFGGGLEVPKNGEIRYVQRTWTNLNLRQRTIPWYSHYINV